MAKGMNESNNTPEVLEKLYNRLVSANRIMIELELMIPSEILLTAT